MKRLYFLSVFVFISNALVKTSSVEVQFGEPYCCGYTTSNEVCHDTCTQLHIPQNRIFFQELQILFPSKCPKTDPKLEEFWKCVNRNNETEAGWVGRRCCESTVTNECRTSCLSANSSADIVGSCIPDDESTLYECILYKESKQKCCGKHHTNASHLCRRHCDNAFEDGPTRKDIQHIRNICDGKMATCMDEYAKTIITTSTKKIHCCEQAEDNECRLGCRNILQTELSNKKIVRRMSEVCGQVIPHEPMWRCFFAGQPRETGVREVGTVSCCHRALSPNCRELCLNIYRDPSSDTHAWKLFDIQCRVPGSEIELNQCLNEVDEPCEMGCKDEMSFCTNFNDRPTELFRSCSASGDENARDEYNKWSGGVIALPTHWIPIKNIQQCEPEQWKAVVCALHIKPCGYKSGHSFICKSDCMALMEKCADTERFGPGMTIEGMCEMFSPDHMQENCISLSTYTKPGQSNIKTIVIQPCNPNPCEGGGHVCVVDRDQCVKCPKHKCVPGCKMGYGSKVNVLQGSLVRLPDSSRGEGCFKACTCLKSGLHKCKPLPCVTTQKSCKIAGQIKSHGTNFYVDCNFCNCFSGNVTCTKRQCLSADSTAAEKQYFTGMPCNCPGTYNPVCGEDGQTYLNSCVAICISLPGSTFSTGTCFGKDPCLPNPCDNRHYTCVATPRVCITLLSKCRQYECILKNRVCKKILEQKSLHPKRRHRGNSPQIIPEIYSSSYFFSPTILALNDNVVCDVKQTRHQDVCKLARKSKLNYKGTCQDKCRSDNDFVCGYDRVTYNNSCIAKSNRVLIDHNGACRRVQTGQDDLKSDPCYGVVCPRLSRKGCSTILPPGSCCPLCGAMINALLNPDHLRSISHTNWKGPVTIRDIMLIMRRQLHVLECDIYGQLTIDGDLAMLVVSSLDHPTLHEIEACNIEAERLFQLISNRSPTLTLYALLWPITAATITCGGHSGSSGVHVSSFLTHSTSLQSIILLCLVHAFLRRFFNVT